MHTTGFAMAGAITPGTVIERVYYIVPSPYVSAPPHSLDGEQGTLDEALRAAIAKRREQVARMSDHYGPADASVGATERGAIYVDVRWVLRFPDGGSSDTIAERYIYEGLDDALAGLANLTRFEAGR